MQQLDILRSRIVQKRRTKVTPSWPPPPPPLAPSRKKGLLPPLNKEYYDPQQASFKEFIPSRDQFSFSLPFPLRDPVANLPDFAVTSSSARARERHGLAEARWRENEGEEKTATSFLLCACI